MSDKLAVKHKNSLALKENKLLVQEGSKPKTCKEPSRPFQLILFPIITCCIFLCYWIILCPLLFNSLYVEYKSKNSSNWPRSWPFYYWLIALLIWLLIMVILIIIWRRLKSRYNNEKPSRSYGSSDLKKPAYLANVKNVYPENITLRNINKDDEKHKNISDNKESNSTRAFNETPNELKKSKDLPPLVIHRQMSGNDIENAGTVKVEKKGDNQNEADQSLEPDEDKSTRNVNRDSVNKDYLKLVTVTPSEDELDVKSPKGPLSPRELFFIDLIREADKAESTKENKDPKAPERRHFFPNDFHPPDDSSTDKTNKDQEKVSPDNTSTQPRESSYFIANVESPTSEKTEVFLEIKPEPEAVKEWTVDLSKENPTLVTESNPETKDKPSEDIVVFEV